jgi:hypothetical protein
MRRFDRRERDKRDLRIALRFSGEERAQILIAAQNFHMTPAAIVKEAVQWILREEKKVADGK